MRGPRSAEGVGSTDPLERHSLEELALAVERDQPTGEESEAASADENWRKLDDAVQQADAALAERTKRREFSPATRGAIERLAEAVEEHAAEDDHTGADWLYTGFDQVRAARIAVAILSLAGAAVVLLFWLSVPDRVIVIKRPDDVQSKVDRTVTSELTRFRAAWHPDERARLKHFAAGGAGHGTGRARTKAIRDVLNKTAHPLVGEAAEYAGVSGAKSLRPDLERIVGSEAAPQLRVRALKAAERLAPWTKAQLRTFLHDDAPAVQLAALEVCASRPEAPIDIIIEILMSTRGQLREAALRAMPDVIPPEALQTIWESAEFGDAEDIEIALRALGRIRLANGDAFRLATLLPRLPARSMNTCLDILSKFESLEHAKGPIWALARDSNLESVVRAHAMYCLEQTNAARPDEIVDSILVLDPLVRYFAARCLLIADREEAVPVLVDLIESDHFEAAVLSRRLLAWMTGRNVGLSKAEFEKILRDLPRRRRRPLPPPGIAFALDD